METLRGKRALAYGVLAGHRSRIEALWQVLGGECISWPSIYTNNALRTIDFVLTDRINIKNDPEFRRVALHAQFRARIVLSSCLVPIARLQKDGNATTTLVSALLYDHELQRPQRMDSDATMAAVATTTTTTASTKPLPSVFVSTETKSTSNFPKHNQPAVSFVKCQYEGCSEMVPEAEYDVHLIDHCSAVYELSL